MIREHTLFYDKSKPYNGIFKYISEESHQPNILSANLIKFKVLSESTNPDHDVFDVILGINNENHNNYYITGSNPEGQWFQIDFIKNAVVPFGYLYKANGKDFFEKFEILGSNDENSWETLDSRENEFGNNDDSHKQVYYQCNQNIFLPFRYLRFQTYGKRSFENYGIAIFGLEFYGSIRPIKICTKYIQMIHIQKSFILFTVISIIKT